MGFFVGNYPHRSLSLCRKANIGLGGLGGAVWIRKQRGCERALFRALLPRRLNPPDAGQPSESIQRLLSQRSQVGHNAIARLLRLTHTEIQDYKSHLIHLYLMLLDVFLPFYITKIKYFREK